ncbi:fas-associated death domain protein isoform X6 [Microplitis demolitor]|uniref:fas-associated death domain protein isoform X6 n=1 Tax=Microplitis demolitor TaxID=69319 RepID=UPI0004CCE60A|nr:fas-associated death domain protein isoform X6 [Microplitis demolitor]
MVDIFIGRDFEMGRLWLNRIPADMDYLSIWNEYQLKYSHLKEKFLDISNLHITCTNLDTIKLSYNRDIYSKRVADDIKDLVGLLKVLENRSVLSYNKIKPLKEIATTYVKDPVLDKIIKDYEDQLHSYQTLPLFNVYKCRSALATSTSTELGSTQPEHQSTSTYHETRYVTTSSYNLPIPDAKTLRLTDLQTKIFYRISENIGRYWRDLARILNVKEAEIDSIDLKDGAIKDKSFESLKIFLSRCESCNWQRKLIRSLEFIRRKDLAEMVEDLLTQNI